MPNPFLAKTKTEGSTVKAGNPFLNKKVSLPTNTQGLTVQDIQSLNPEQMTSAVGSVGATANRNFFENPRDMFRLVGNNWSPVNSSFEDYNDVLAANQPMHEKIMLRASRIGANTGAGTFQSANYDVEGVAKMAMGVQDEHLNWMDKIANSFMDTKLKGTIYSKKGWEDDFWSAGYLGQLAETTAFSVGLAVGDTLQYMAATALLAPTLGGSAVTFGMKATQIAKRGTALAKFAKIAGGGFAFGAAKGIFEARMNGAETYKNVYDTLTRDHKMGHDEAVAYASKAASDGFKMEAGSLAMINGLQFGLLGAIPGVKGLKVNPGFSGTLETVGDVAFKGIANKTLRGAAKFSFATLSEGVEEVIQTKIGQKELRDVLKQVGKYNHFQEEDFWNRETVDSFIAGMFGGGVMSGMGKIHSAVTGKKDARNRAIEYDKAIAKSTLTMQDAIVNLDKAHKSGSKAAVFMAEQNITSAGILSNLYNDSVFGTEDNKNKASDTYITHLASINKALTDNDTEKLKSYGIETKEQVERAKSLFPGLQDKAIQVRKIYEDNLEATGDAEAAIHLTRLDDFIFNATDTIDEIKAGLDNYYENNMHYSQLSDNGKKYVNNIVSNIKNRKDVYTEEEKAQMSESVAQAVKGLKGLSKVDKALINNLDLSDIIGAQTEIEVLEQEVVEHQKEKAKWDTTEGVKGILEERYLRGKVQNIKTESKLDEYEQKLKNSGKLTSDLKSVIAAKRDAFKKPGKTDSNVSKPGAPPVSVVNANTPAQAYSPTPASQNPVINAPAQEQLPDDLLDSGATMDTDIWAKLMALKAENVASTEANTGTLSEVNTLVEGVVTPNEDVSQKDTDYFDVKTQEEYDVVLDNIYMSLEKFRKGFEAEHNRPLEFEDIIAYLVKNKGKEFAEKVFKVYADVFKKYYGLTEDIENKVRNRYINYTSFMESTLDIAEDAASYNNPAVTSRVVSETVNEAPKEDTKTVITNDGTPVVYKGFKIVSPELKAAYSTLATTTEATLNPETGLMEVKVSDAEEEISREGNLNPLIPVNPERLLPGEELSIEFDREGLVSNWGDTLVTDTDGLGSTEKDLLKKDVISFAKWAENVPERLPDGSINPLWLSKVPIIVKDKNGVPVFMIHDTQYYNRNSVALLNDSVGNPDYETQSKTIAEARKNALKVRTQFYSNPNSKIKITTKENGKHKQGEQFVPLSELFKGDESKIKIGVKRGNSIIVNGQPFKGNVVNEDYYFELPLGANFEVRETAVKGNYKIFRTYNSALSTKNKETFMQVITALASNDNNSKALIKQVNETLGTDIRSAHGLTMFLNMFVRANGTSKGLAKGLPYIFAEGPFIQFGRAGEPNNFINMTASAEAIRKSLGKLRELLDSGTDEIYNGNNGSNMKVLQNVSENNLSIGVSGFSIDANGNFSKEPIVSMLSQSLTSNIKTFNIGENGETNMISFVQPNIFYQVEEEVTEGNPTETAEGVQSSPVSPEINLTELRSEAFANLIVDLQNKGILTSVDENGNPC